MFNGLKALLFYSLLLCLKGQLLQPSFHSRSEIYAYIPPQLASFEIKTAIINLQPTDYNITLKNIRGPIYKASIDFFASCRSPLFLITANANVNNTTTIVSKAAFPMSTNYKYSDSEIDSFKSARIFLYVLFSSTAVLVIALFVTDNSHFAFTFIEQLQILSYFKFLPMAFPAIIEIFLVDMSYFFNFTLLSMIGRADVDEGLTGVKYSLLGEKIVESVSMDVIWRSRLAYAWGFSSSFLVINTFKLVLIAFITLLYLTLKYILQKKWYTYFEFSFFFRLFQFFFLEFMLSIIIQLSDFKTDSVVTQANSILALITLVFIALYFFISIYITNNIGALMVDQAQYLRKYGVFFKGINFSSFLQRNFQVFLQLRKLIVVVLVCFTTKDSTEYTFEISYSIIIVFTIAYIEFYKPFENEVTYRLFTFNEILIVGILLLLANQRWADNIRTVSVIREDIIREKVLFGWFVFSVILLIFLRIFIDGIGLCTRNGLRPKIVEKEDNYFSQVEVEMTNREQEKIEPTSMEFKELESSKEKSSRGMLKKNE